MFVLVTAAVLWQSTTIYLNDTGVVAGASVESNASVEANQYNTWNAQLQAKEAELRNQEIELLTTQHERDRKIMIYLYAIAGSLLALILVNFYLDFRRYHHRAWTA